MSKYFYYLLELEDRLTEDEKDKVREEYRREGDESLAECLLALMQEAFDLMSKGVQKAEGPYMTFEVLENEDRQIVLNDVTVLVEGTARTITGDMMFITPLGTITVL